MQQADGGAALDFEERFEGGAVDDGRGHLPQGRECGRHERGPIDRFRHAVPGSLLIEGRASRSRVSSLAA